MKKQKILNEDEDFSLKKNSKSSMDRINGWLEDQYERHQMSSPLTDSDWYENDSNKDSGGYLDQNDDLADDLPDDIGKTSVFRYSKEIYEMKCEWMECDYKACKVDDFVRHVADHSPQTEQRYSETLFCCLWDSCGFDSKDVDVVVRHINYHAYHTKIKAIGSSIVNSSKLPACALDYAGRNLLPVLPLELNCEWDNCNQEFNNFQFFLNHVQCHVLVLPMRGCVKPKKIICEWRDCKKTFNNCHKLREHMRTHTQEKMVGCPVCGTQFSNKTKFYDHCMRQMTSNRKGFKCLHCKKNFPTERILRDHIRLHINLFKCPLCDMTCPFQSTLALHVRYRHISLKAFQCNFCEHRSKTQRDLENHQLTHCSENFWVCEQEDCDYSCRSKNVLKEHYAKNHTQNLNLCIYYCHICSKKYKRGSDLTVHLKKQHSYRWASGHSRFKYNRGDDGIYRLQTMRYESIEVTKEMMQAKAYKTETPPQKKLVCIFESPVSFVVKEEDENDKSAANAVTYPTTESSSDLAKLDDESTDSSNFEDNLRKQLGFNGMVQFYNKC